VEKENQLLCLLNSTALLVKEVQRKVLEIKTGRIEEPPCCFDF